MRDEIYIELKICGQWLPCLKPVRPKPMNTEAPLFYTGADWLIFMIITEVDAEGSTFLPKHKRA